MPSRSLSRSTAVHLCAFSFAKLVQTLHGIFPYRVFKTWSIRTVHNNNSPIYKREGDGNLNVSRNGFWNSDLIVQSGQ